MLLPGPIIMLLQRGAETVQKPNQSKRERARVEVTRLIAALDNYALQHVGLYPDSLQALIEPDSLGHRHLNLTRGPRDPWKREYIYTRDPVNVATLGADGKPGGTGDDADIDYQAIIDGR